MKKILLAPSEKVINSKTSVCPLFQKILFTLLLILFTNPSFSQFFPNPATLSTGQGAPNTTDPIWLASPWYTSSPPNPMGLPYISTLINNNCAPGSWVDPASLPAPVNNGNWITGSDDDCANNMNSGYRYFRLTLNLPPDCNGYSVTVAGNYVLDLIGYVDNTITDVFINGNSTGISGGSYAAGSQLNIHLVGPWVPGVNYVDILVYNVPQPTPGINPYGLLLVANASSTAGMDTDGDGVSNLDDLCPCEAGTNPVGCTDPSTNGCNIPAIRAAFAAAGCIELFGCMNECSMYFLNPTSMSGSQAQAFAQNLGANLISVQSAAENQCIINEINTLGYAGVIWIGFSDEVTEGTFVWYDQAPVVYTNWAPGEPNQAGNEDCTQIYPDGSWNDLSCNSANAKSIIEVNLCPIINAGTDVAICTGKIAPLNASNTLFGSSPYTYTWNNGVNTQSNPVSPTVNSTYSVVTVDRYSCTASDTVKVTVNPLPTVNAGTDVSICLGGSVTLSGSGAATYLWNNGVTNGVAFSPTATTTYTVTGKDANGCDNTDQVTVTVNPLPLVNAGIDQAVCTGSAVTLTGAGATSYAWNNSVTNGTAFTPTATTTYTLTGTDANGCINTDQVIVTVNPLPAVNAGADQAVCTGGSVTLSGSGATSYVWNNSVTNGMAFPPTATTTYTVTGTNANGCVNTDQVIVTVHPLPAVNAGLDQAICIGGPATLTGTGAVSYTWNYSVVNATPFNPTATNTYTVNGTDVNGCVNTDQVIVTVNPLPLVNAGIDQAVCIGGSVTLSGSGAVNYTWNNSVSNALAFVPTATTNYTVTGTDANGCVNTDQVTVVVNPIPTVSFQASDVFGCLPMDIKYTATGYNSNCLWTFGDGSSSTTCGTVTHTYTTSGCYNVSLTITSNEGCVGQETMPNIVCIPPNPIAAFTSHPGTLTILDSKLFLQNASTNASQYVWNFGDGSNSQLVSPTHIFPTGIPGTYEIYLVAANDLGCTDTAYATIVIQDEIIYYVPNAFTPDGDQYNQVFKPVFTAGFDPYDYNLYIYNRWGEIVFESHDATAGWNGNYGAYGLAQEGVYTWRIEFKTTRSDERKVIVGHVSLLK